MVFGVFDGLHEGHRFFINEAKKQGNKLVIVVARDSIVELLKNKKPSHNEVERQRQLADCERGAMVILGDREMGAYEVIKQYEPDVICLGYDQEALATDLRHKMKAGAIPDVKLIEIGSHKSDKYHSSLLL